MSYSISYGSDTPKLYQKKKGYMGLIGAILIIMICAAAIGWAIPQQAKAFAQALFPWTREEVRFALTELRRDILDGQPLSDAVTTFCREIIYEANWAQ